MRLLITGSNGLVGSEAVEYYCARGNLVVGIDNDLRAYFFGHEASTRRREEELCSLYPRRFFPKDIDIRDHRALREVFSNGRFDAVLHTASQPSHDWAAREPLTDFSVNAVGTLNLLECAREFCPEAPFIFVSTNKVYGDQPNRLPLIELETRWEIDPGHGYAAHGIPESMSVDDSMHSIFGVSKASADLMVQEYGRYFGLPTVSFRGGCLTGPLHAAAELHGFLAYLGKCIANERPYRIYGYKGKQVRDNIHVRDLIEAFEAFRRSPRAGAVYNIGGGRKNNISMLEAIASFEDSTGRRAKIEYIDEPRRGDHIWYVSDLTRFQRDYPNWSQQYTIREIVNEIAEVACGATAT